MDNVVVTGANGFLGNWLIQQLVKNGDQVCAVVKDEKEDISQLSKLENVFIVYNDMTAMEYLHEKMPRGYKADIFYHLAWIGTSGSLRADYSLQLMNAKYTCDAVHAAKKIGCYKFIGAGSLAEWDCLGYSPMDGAIPNATTHYAAAKVAAEYMSKAECNKMKIEHIWGIFSNIYGVGNTTDNFVNYASRLMLEGKKAAFTDGMQNYDFVYISDFIDGLYRMGKYGRNNCSYFIGSGNPQTMRNYIYQIRDTIDPSIELYLGEIPFHGISLPTEKLSSAKLTKDTGYQPKVDFKEGIKMTIDWLKLKQAKQASSVGV